MIKIENVDVCGWETAIRGMRAKGYRKTKKGYEAFVSVKSHTKMLGTYSTEIYAKNAVSNFRIKRFLDGVHKHGLDESNCALVYDNYVVFKSGEIFNLHGEEMKGMIDKSGYKEVIMNGVTYRVHRVVAETFIKNGSMKPCVNHIDGNKLNNDVNNLEWVTHSENTIHAYNTGLEKKVFGEKHHAHKLVEKDVKYIRSVCKKHDPEFGYTALSKKFGVDRTTIADVVNENTWRGIV